MYKHATVEGQFRYTLTRQWNDQCNMVMYIMLNPSTADAQIDDPTIRRLIGFTQGFGWGGFHVGNLFPFRATDPKDLFKWLHSQGNGTWRSDNSPEWMLENLRHLRKMSEESTDIILAWGANGMSLDMIKTEDYWPGLLFHRQADFLRWRDNLHHFGTTSGGAPKHPLYLASNTPLLKV